MKKFWLPLTLVLASILPVPTVLATDMPAPTAQSHRGNSGNHRQQGEKKSEHNKGGNQRPGNNRPNNNSNNKRPGNNPGNQRPGNSGNNHNPGNQRPGNPGNNHNPGNHRPGNPGNNHNPGNHRPGNPGTPPPPPGRPGNTHRPGNSHGTSMPRPGNHGHYSHSHWHPLPPPPPRPKHIHHYHNVRPSFLGLTLGTMFDIGLNTLINGGFNVVYAADNIMGLTNVNQFGVLWPEASFFYGPAGMTGARFQRITPIWDDWAFNTAYAQLNTLYGQPESVTRTRNSLSAIWWTGGNSYVTLTCSAAPNGIAGYSTDLIFGN